MSAEFQLAVKSKQQGDTLDYHVLACSPGRLSTEDFESLFKSLSVGTMPLKPRSTGESQPWITVGSFKRGEQCFVAVIRQEWTARLDAYGRPVAALFCLCVPDGVLLDSGPSYMGLSALMPGQQFFLSGDSEPLGEPEISFAPLEKELLAVTALIQDYGFEFCAHVVALLLQSSVVIMKGQGLSVDARLSFMDAVVSLLPYGCRADLGVSTWMSSTTDKIHIGFSDVVLPNQTRVGWRASADARPELSGAAGQYYKHLVSIWERAGRCADSLIAGLAKEKQQLSLSDTASLLKTLREFDLENIVAEENSKRRANGDDIRRVLRLNSLGLDKETVIQLVSTVLREPRLDDMDILRRHWDRSLWVPACEAVKTTLQFPKFQTETLNALCEFAAGQGWLDNFLDYLLQPDADATRGNTLELLYSALVQFPHDQTRVRYLLFRSPRTLYEYLFMLGQREQSEERLEEVLVWLEDDEVNRNELNVYTDKLGVARGSVSSEAILSPFRVAFGLRSDGEVSRDMIRLLGKFSGEYVLKLAELAVLKARATQDYLIIGRLARPLSDWLMGQAGHLSGVEAERWRDVLLAMRNLPKVSVDLDVRLDLLSLFMWQPPEALLFDQYVDEGAAEVDAYVGKFTRQIAAVDIVDQEVIENLVAYLGKTERRSPARIIGETYLLSEVVSNVTSRDVRDALASHVSRNIAEYPQLLTHEAFSGELKRRLKLWGAAGAVLDAAVQALWGMAQRRRPLDEILDQYLAILSLGESDFEDKVVHALDAHGYLASLEQIRDFMRELHGRLRGHFERNELVVRYFDRFADALLSVESVAVEEYYVALYDTMIASLELLGRKLRSISKRLDDERAHQLKAMLEQLRKDVPTKGFIRFRQK